MRKTTAEFTIPGGAEPGLFRVEHRSDDWTQDVATGSAILQVQHQDGGWLDYMTIRSEDEVERIDRALHQALQASAAKTPTEAEIRKILSRHFPAVGFETDETAEVDAIAIRNAVAQAFAAGRDFEGRLRDRRAERDAKAGAR
jgi:hypothetical protein